MKNFVFSKDCKWNETLFEEFKKYKNFLLQLFVKNKIQNNNFLHTSSLIMNLIKKAGIMTQWYLGTLLIDIQSMDFIYQSNDGEIIDLTNKRFMGYGMYKFLLKKLYRGEENLTIKTFVLGFNDNRDFVNYIKLWFRTYKKIWISSKEYSQDTINTTSKVTKVLKKNTYFKKTGEIRGHNPNNQTFLNFVENNLNKNTI